MIYRSILWALVGILALSTPAVAQCILANPSFEIGGAGSSTFGGWNQFGTVGLTNNASHGAQAARVSGPNTGSWDVSGYWQSQDCQPGERWDITGHVLNPSVNPLTGQNVAIVNIEWRNATGDLIDYDTFNVADAASAVDTYLDFSMTSSAAPVGTATCHLLLGILQSPNDPSSDVYYDQATFYSTTAPTIDDLQWNDFYSGLTLSFSGYTWRIKGPGWYGPGNNYFYHQPSCLWVDENDRLHLTLQDQGSTWTATEVVNQDALGYGDYIMTTVGRLDLLDPQAVMGIFLWEYGTCWDDGYVWWNAYNEIDIEYSRWGNPSRDIAQFVAQPYNYAGNTSRFDATFSEDEVVSHAMRWLHDKIEYRVWRGGPNEASAANMIHAWTYTGPHIPRPEQPRLHLNLWKLDGTPAEDQEIIFESFVFVPEGGATPVVDNDDSGLPAAPAGRLHPAAPNPFNPQTTIQFRLERPGATEVKVYDINGHLVRTLVSAHLSVGEHQVTWDGRSDSGKRLASGTYLLSLQGAGYTETRGVTLLK